MGIFSILNKLFSRYSAILEVEFMRKVSNADFSSLYVDALLQDYHSGEKSMFIPVLEPKSLDVSTLRNRLLQTVGAPNYVKYYRSSVDGNYYIVGGDYLKEEYDAYQKHNYKSYSLHLVLSSLLGFLLSVGLTYLSKSLFRENTLSGLIFTVIFAFICTVFSLYLVSVFSYYALHIFGVFDRNVVEFICLEGWNGTRSKVFPRELREV